MNYRIWIGIIVWGIVATAFGLLTAGPASAAQSTELPAQDVVFLVAGGMLSCLIGCLGLLGMAGWLPGFRGDKESAA